MAMSVKKITNAKNGILNLLKKTKHEINLSHSQIPLKLA